MPRRVYLCRVIGTGATPDDPVRPEVADHITTWTALIRSVDAGQDRGRPAYPWCLVMVDAPLIDHVRLVRDLDIYGFPIGLRGRLADQTTAERTRLQATLTARGIAEDAGDQTFIGLARRLGEMHVPGFRPETWGIDLE